MSFDNDDDDDDNFLVNLQVKISKMIQLFIVI